MQWTCKQGYKRVTRHMKQIRFLIFRESDSAHTQDRKGLKSVRYVVSLKSLGKSFHNLVPMLWFYSGIVLTYSSHASDMAHV